jgi:hypothetical protein
LRYFTWNTYCGEYYHGMLRLLRFHADVLLGLFFDPEDGGDIFFRNVGWLSMDYTALYPRRKYSSRINLVLNVSFWLTRFAGPWNVEYSITVYTREPSASMFRIPKYTASRPRRQDYGQRRRNLNSLFFCFRLSQKPDRSGNWMSCVLVSSESPACGDKPICKCVPSAETLYTIVIIVRNFLLSQGVSTKLLLALASTGILGSGPRRDLWANFYSFQGHLCLWKLCLLFDKGRGWCFWVGATFVARVHAHSESR